MTVLPVQSLFNVPGPPPQTWRNGGWEVLSPVIAPKPFRRAAAVMQGEPGIEAKFVPPSLTVPWEYAPTFNYRYPGAPGGPAPGRSPDTGDQGIYSQLTGFFPDGWEATLPPPRWPGTAGGPAPGRSPDIGDQGTYSPYAVFRDFGREMPPVVRYHVPVQKRGAILKGDDGSQAGFQRWNNSGWEVQPWQPPHFRKEKFGSLAKGEDGTEATQFVWAYLGFEQVPPPQPPHPRPERNAAWMEGDSGRQATFVFWHNDGWEVQSWQPPAVPKWLTRRGTGLKSRSEFAFFAVPFAEGWQIQHYQPQRIRYRNLDHGDDGAEAPFIPPTNIPFFWTGETNSAIYPRWPALLRAAGLMRGDDGTLYPLLGWVNDGWEVAPPHLRPWPHKPYSAIGDRGIAAPFIPPPIIPFKWGHEYHQLFARRFNRINAVLRGDDGTQAPFIMPFIEGWAIQSWQPPHPRPERFGALAVGDNGTEAPFVPPIIIPSVWGYAFSQEIVRRPNRIAGVLLGDDGIEGKFIVPFKEGWAVQPWQPRHPRPERGGAIMVGDGGTEAPFVFVPPALVWSYESLLPISRKIQRITFAGDDGIEAPFIFVPPAAFPTGFEHLHIHLKSRPRALALWDDGISDVFRYFYHVWDETAATQRHQPWNRVGAFTGISNIDARLTTIHPGWEQSGLILRPSKRAFAQQSAFNVESRYSPLVHGWDVGLPQPSRRVRPKLITPIVNVEVSFAFHGFFESTEAFPLSHRYSRKNFDAGDLGIEHPFIPPVTPLVAWDFMQNQPFAVHKRLALAFQEWNIEVPFFYLFPTLAAGSDVAYYSVAAYDAPASSVPSYDMPVSSALASDV